jgi:hypothetical protein
LSEQHWEEALDECEAPDELKRYATLDLHNRLGNAEVKEEEIPEFGEIERMYYSSGYKLEVPVCYVCSKLTETELPLR